MTHKFKSVDYKIKCSFYDKNLEACPSSKTCLSENDLKIITEKCVTENYKSCSIYEKLTKEKAA